MSSKERTPVSALGVSIPTPGQPPEEIFKECCYTHLTLAIPSVLKTIIFFFTKDKFHRKRWIVPLLRSTNEHPLIDETFGSFMVLDRSLTNNSHQVFGEIAKCYGNW
jgi:hypothetical protein